MIWLLRHGEAAEGSPDAERRLTEEGERQARAVGTALAVLGVDIDACFCSPKVRAADTARLACHPLGLEPQHEPKLAGGPFDPEQLAAGLGEVLLVAHDPDLSMAVHAMTGAQVHITSGGLAALESGELRLLLRPGELQAIAASSPPEVSRPAGANPPG